MKLDKKQQILNTAVELFNREGFSNISVRDISKQLGISPGNLTYHFKKKEDIILEIHNRMMEEFLAEANFEIIGFEDLDRRIGKWYTLQEKYMFIFCDLIVLTRTYPELHEIHRSMFDKYDGQLVRLLNRFVSQGLIKPEPLEGAYGNIANILNIMLPLTISVNKIIYREDYNADKIKNLVWGILIPLLTENGLEEYRKMKMKN